MSFANLISNFNFITLIISCNSD